MNFKKYNEMELALLASIASMTKEEMENITVEKGDYDAVTMEDCTSTPFYISKPNAKDHAMRRKATFKKKVEQKDSAHDLGYNISTENNSKKVKDLLSSNHSDRFYMSGDKSFKKYMSINEEMNLMEQEEMEKTREDMMEYHDSILGSIGQDIDTLTMDAESIEYRIEDLETEYKKLEEAMKLVSEKLKNAQLRKNGVFAALRQKEEEYKETNDKLMQEMHRFGW